MRGRRALPSLLAVLLAGCPGARGGNPSWRTDRARPGKVVLFRPAGAGAERYNEPSLPAPPASPLGDALVAAAAAAAEANGRAAPLPDARLFAAAADLAAILEEDGLPPYEAVDFALSHHGVIEPSPHLIVVGARNGEQDAAVSAIAERLPEVMLAARFSRMGVGAAPRGEDHVMIVVALLESGIEAEPIPRRLPRGATLALRGRVLSPYAQPRLFVTTGDGQVDRPPVVRDDEGGFRAEVPCGAGGGKRQVEVTAQGPHGVTVLANFPIWCGDAPPTELAVALSTAADDAVADASEAERRLLTLVNEDRRRAGLPPLAWSEQAAAIARAHSQDMRDSGFVGHVSPTSGTAADRTRRAGLGTSLVLENVARAFSPTEAETGFMNSPGHRANLLSPEATHLGIGVVFGDQVAGRHELYVTQLFYRVPPALGKKDAVARARRALSARRDVAGVGSLRADGDLDAIAQRFAEGLAARRRPRDELAADASRALDDLADRYESVTTILTVVGDPSDLESDGFLDPRMRAYGVGVAQGNDEEVGENAFYVVVILARGR